MIILCPDCIITMRGGAYCHLWMLIRALISNYYPDPISVSNRRHVKSLRVILTPAVCFCWLLEEMYFFHNFASFIKTFFLLLFAAASERSAQQLGCKARPEDLRTQWDCSLGTTPLRLLRSIFLIGPQRTETALRTTPCSTPSALTWNGGSEGTLKKYIPHYLWAPRVFSESWWVFLCI